MGEDSAPQHHHHHQEGGTSGTAASGKRTPRSQGALASSAAKELPAEVVKLSVVGSLVESALDPGGSAAGGAGRSIKHVFRRNCGDPKLVAKVPEAQSQGSLLEQIAQFCQKNDIMFDEGPHCQVSVINNTKADIVGILKIN